MSEVVSLTSRRSIIYLLHIVSTTVTDDLATQGATISAEIVLIRFLGILGGDNYLRLAYSALGANDPWVSEYSKWTT